MTSKNFAKLGATFLCVALIVPVVSSAAATTPTSMMGERPARGERLSTSSKERPVFSCEKIDDMEEKVLTRLGERVAERTGKPSRDGAAPGKEERMAKLTTERTEHDAKRAERYDSMRAKATTDEQKAAIEEFISTMEALIADRKEAVDTAITNFEEDAAALKVKADAARNEKTGDIEADTKAVFDDVRGDCTDSSTAEEIRAAIKTGLDTLHTQRKTDREMNTYKTEFEALRATRKAAVEAAIADFKAGFESAKTELKTALGTPAA
jgi:hypothetical protein